jgi:hypothetical protein
VRLWILIGAAIAAFILLSGQDGAFVNSAVHGPGWGLGREAAHHLVRNVCIKNDCRNAVLIPELEGKEYRVEEGYCPHDRQKFAARVSPSRGGQKAGRY